jgi:hypothetical protein
MAVTTDNLDLPYEERLRLYQTNTYAAQQETLRVKKVYDEEMRNGASQERLNQISTWAGQVRAAAGIQPDDVIYGNNPAVSPDVQKATTELYYNQQSYTPSGNINGNYGIQTPSYTTGAGSGGGGGSTQPVIVVPNGPTGLQSLGDKNELIQIGAIVALGLIMVSLFKG